MCKYTIDPNLSSFIWWVADLLRGDYNWITHGRTNRCGRHTPSADFGRVQLQVTEHCYCN